MDTLQITTTERLRREKISNALKGRKHSDIHNQNVSRSLMGNKISEVTKQKLRDINTGKILSKETRAKISIGLKKRFEDPQERKKVGRLGHVVTEETRKKLSESHKGITQSKETRDKISNKLKGRKLSEDHIKKMRVIQKQRYEDPIERQKQSERLKGIPHKPLKGARTPFYGKHHTEETKEKNRLAHMGKTPSKETKKKMSSQRQKEKHWNWKGGVSFEPYCPKFDAPFKEGVRILYNYTCQICGHVWQLGEHKLGVHHVNYNKMVCCNNVEPMFVVLCHGRCHSITNYHREYWEELFTNLILLEHDGKSYFTRDELKEQGLI